MPATHRCPDCGAKLPVHEGFVTWCHDCGWNVSAPQLAREPRTRFERLHALVDQVAAALEMPTVDVIVVDYRVNATWGIAGVRRRRVLTLRLPLLMMLGPQERVALIGHELAHARNGDSSRGGSRTRG